MASSKFPKGIDIGKLAEAALAILSLTLHDDGRVWKSLDWNLMDLLVEKGWVVNAQSKSNCGPGSNRPRSAQWLPQNIGHILPSGDPPFLRP